MGPPTDGADVPDVSPGAGRSVPAGDADRLSRAAAIVERLSLDAAVRAQLTNEVLAAALDQVEAGLAAPPATRLFGHRLEEGDLRRGLERTYRELARLAPTVEERVRLVDRANRVRPVTLV